MPKSHNTFSLFRMQELTPSMTLELLKSGMRILTIALITVVKTVIWSSGPHQLRHGFGQHTQVLLAGFESLLRPFPVIDVSGGAKPLQGRSLRILVWHGSRPEPTISSAGAIAQPPFPFQRGACGLRRPPRVQGALSGIWV